MVVSAYPRRYLAEVVLTNRSEQPIYVENMSVTMGSRNYAREDGSKPCRIEPLEYKELAESFPVDDDAPDFGDFVLEVWPAVGASTRVAGTFAITSS